MSRELDLGFVALCDAAPLIVAHELDMFGAEGLEVRLHREVSWATIRDKTATQVFHGAHMLAPMAIATAMGIGAEPAQLIAPLSLNANGASIGVSRALADEMAAAFPDAPHSAEALARAAEARRIKGQPAIAMAIVFGYSLHAYMLCFWAASAGLDPDRDLRLVVAAPTAIARRLAAGEIDGFCVGAPWGEACAAESGAKIVLTAQQFWPAAPDKVFALNGAWAGSRPEDVQALTRAVLRAALWADAPENARSLAEMLAQSAYLDAPRDLIAQGLTGIRFARGAAAFPWRSKARWVLSQMRRWGQIGTDADIEKGVSVYRPSLYRTAATALSLTAPLADEKAEGAHSDPWALPGTSARIEMEADRLIDQRTFRPESLEAYAASFAITRLP